MGVGVVQALFLAAALLCLPRHPAGANRMLAVLLGVFALMFSYDTLHHLGLLDRYPLDRVPLLVFLRLPLLFLYGPLTWLYLGRVTESAPANRSQDKLHFLPFVLVCLLYLPCLVLSEIELRQVIAYAELARRPGGFQLGALQQWLWNITAYWRMPAFLLHLGVYLGMSLLLLRRHRRRIRENFSYRKKISLDWVAYLIVMLVGIWLLVAVVQFTSLRSAAGEWLGGFLALAQVVFVFLIGLFGLLQVRIFEGKEDSQATPAEPQEASYQNSGLTHEQIRRDLVKLLAFMEKEKPYLESDLSLAGLAGKLNLPARHLSQIVNAGLGKHFLDFVNSYRVEEAKRLLDGAASFSVLDIAMEVGFNSKSAFYNAFRRHAGVTPSQYRCRPAPLSQS